MRRYQSTPMFGLAPIVWCWCWGFYALASRQIHMSNADIAHVHAQRLKYHDLLRGATLWRH